jgi:ABC-2 type transport system permease protein
MSIAYDEPTGQPSGQTTGVIHDIGYRNYEGERIGRAGIVRALYWHSLRSAFGIGRGGRAKVVPILAFVIMCLPAAVNAFTVARTGTKAIQYDAYIYQFQLILVLYLAAVTPELISRDLRNHTLPLYFSRPLRRADYPLAKVAALITALFALTAIPELLLYIGTIGSLHGGSEVWHETRAFFPGILISAGYAVLFALLAAVLACFTGRRAFATGAVAVFFFGTFIISSALIRITGGFEHVQQSDSGALIFTPQTSTPTGAQVSAMLNPSNLLEGLRLWIVGHPTAAHRRPRDVAYPDTLGPVYLLVAVALAAICALILIRRYRKAGQL